MHSPPKTDHYKSSLPAIHEKQKYPATNLTIQHSCLQWDFKPTDQSKGNIMKKSLLCVALAVASTLPAEESVENLRKEFLAYRKASEARIQSLEKREGRAPEDSKTWERALLGFEFHGYFRAGLGVNGEGDAIEAFKAPNSGAKYRLGNEAESYIELTYQQNFLSRELLHDDIDFFTKVTVAYVTPPSNNNAFDATTSIREAYAGARGVWDSQKEAMFWAGNRYYERIDLHINDFFFRDLAGFGGGVEDVAIGDDLKMALAWLGGTIDELSSNGTVYENENDYHFNKNMVDLRLYNLDTGFGMLALNADVAYFNGDELSPGSTPADDIIIDSCSGWALGAILSTELNDNLSTRASIQYGAGAADNFKTVMTAPQGISIPTSGGLYIDPGDATRLRITDDILIKTGNPISLQGIVIYERYDNGFDTIDWVSMGARPVYHFNKYFSLAFEGGADYTNQEDGPEGVLGKFTLAPQIQPGREHFSRPSIRAFATYAVWTGSDDFEQAVAPVSYGSDTQGFSFGVQMEAWW
jgi:maltoporin